MRGCSATALDPHVELEIDVGETRDAGDRRGVAIVRRGGERNMAFPGEQARGRIEPDPAGARKIDLGPGVEVGEVVVGARRPVEGDQIGLQLDQIAGHEPRGEAEIAQDLHQEPARIAARARRRARTSPPDFAPPAPCGSHMRSRAARRRLRSTTKSTVRLGDRSIPFEKRRQPRPRRFGRAIDDEIGPQVLAIFERPHLRALLDEESRMDCRPSCRRRRRPRSSVR